MTMSEWQKEKLKQLAKKKTRTEKKVQYMKWVNGQVPYKSKKVKKS